MSAAPPKRRPGRPKTVDRDRAIELAMDLWWRDGISGSSLNEVCRRVQLSKPALYREFGGQDGLMEAALAHYEEQVIAPVLAATQIDLPFADLVELLVVGMTQAAGPAGCLFTELRLAQSRLGEATMQRLRAMERHRRQVFEDWYQRALDRGEVDPSIPPALAARYIDTQTATALAQLGVGEPAELVAQQARLAFRTLWSPSS